MMFRLGNRGMSLLEIMVVVAIIGILAGVAIPSFMGWLPKIRVDGATAQVSSDLQIARMRSVSENYPYEVAFDLAHNSYTLYKITRGADNNPVLNLVKTVTLDDYPGIIFGYNITLNPDGTATTGSAVFTNPGATPTTTTFEEFMPNGTAVYSGVIFLAPSDDLANSRYDRNRAITVETTGFIKTWTHDDTAGGPWS